MGWRRELSKVYQEPIPLGWYIASNYNTYICMWQVNLMPASWKISKKPSQKYTSQEKHHQLPLSEYRSC